MAYGIIWNTGILTGVVHVLVVINFDCTNIKKIIDGHNMRRRLLAEGKVKNQPAATKMTYLSWDDELATKAAEWARNCEFEHNPNRTIPSGRFIAGENLNLVITSVKNLKYNPMTAVKSWFGEYKDYKYKTMEPSDFSSGVPKIGHYTQMVWANTYYVGCAASIYSSEGWTRMLTVCNYGPTGNYFGEKPYVAGKPSNKLVCGTNDCSRLYGDDCKK